MVEKLTAHPETEVFVPRSNEYNLVEKPDVVRLLDDSRPELVIHLAAVVGGSGLFAACVFIKQSVGWQLSSILSGVIMLVWIVVEIASIRGFHVLQVVYLVTGAAVIWRTPRDAR